MVLSKTFSRLLSRFRKQILIAFDILVISLAYIAPWVIINGRADYQRYSSLLVASWFLFVSCFEIVYALMGVYDSLWRYAEIVEFFRLCVASIIAVALFGVTSFFIFSETRVPISVYFLSAAVRGGPHPLLTFDIPNVPERQAGQAGQAAGAAHPAHRRGRCRQHPAPRAV